MFHLSEFWHGIWSDELVFNKPSDETHGLWGSLTQFFFPENYWSKDLYVLQKKQNTAWE